MPAELYWRRVLAVSASRGWRVLGMGPDPLGRCFKLCLQGRPVWTWIVLAPPAHPAQHNKASRTRLRREYFKVAQYRFLVGPYRS